MLALLALTAGVYFSTLNAPFVYDDYFHIVANTGIHTLTNLRALFHSGFQETRPIFVLSLALNYFAGGSAPLVYHVTNLVIHLANGLLFLAVLMLVESFFPERRNGKIRWVPIGAASIFLLHPLQTESVIYINSRSGLLMTSFVLACVATFLEFRRSPSIQRSILFYGASLLFEICALLSKENAVVLPVLLLGADFFLCPRRTKSSVRSDFKIHAPFWFALAVIPTLYMFFETPHYRTIGLEVMSPRHHFLTQAGVWVRFLEMYLVPIGQNIDHDFEITTSLFDPRFLFSFGLLGLLFGAAVKYYRKLPLFTLGLAWFAVTLSPTNSIVPFRDFMAERHLYLPLAGLSLATVVLIEQLGKRAVGIAAIAWIILLTGMTYARNQVWNSEVSLWQDSVGKSPQKPRPYLNLGAALADEGRYTEAEVALRHALTLNPTYPEALFNLGFVLRKSEREREAQESLRRLLLLEPHHVDGRTLLAKSLAKDGRLDDAVQLLRDGYIYPGAFPKCALLAAQLEIQAGRSKAAEKTLKDALRRAPAIPPLYMALGRLYWNEGKKPQALSAFHEALSLSGTPAAELERASHELASLVDQEE
ncbi:MAG TPA: tetratricopeptide repeat protein [Bdellovibrionota bacterium]|nr:tetratricopeptide repeat protein [Bdellovibrionota bacterium]